MSPNSQLTFYEFFAGGGMARLGLGSEWKCLFANDFDAVKATAYRANFPDADEHFHYGDVWKVGVAELKGQADLAWASSPCQDFSLAGLRAGLKGGRSSAFYGFWRLVEDLNREGRAPRTIVIENVVGLLTSHRGNDFQALCKALADEGYWFGAIEIDAIRFVPQSRPRVFVVACKAKPANTSTVVEARLPYHSKRVAQAFAQLPADLQQRWCWWSLPFPPRDNRKIDAILDKDDSAIWLSAERRDNLLSMLNPLHARKLADAKLRKERVVGTLFRRMRKEDGTNVQRAELRFDGYAGCLRMPGGGSSRQFIVVVNDQSVKIRPLSPSEGARMMGLSEDYNLPRGTTASLKVLGDGVVVPVVRFLRTELIEHLVEPLESELHGAEILKLSNAG